MEKPNTFVNSFRFLYKFLYDKFNILTILPFLLKK